MKVLLTRWKNTYRALATDDAGVYKYEVSALYDRKGRLYINATVADPLTDGVLMLSTARIIADAVRAGMSASDVLAMIVEKGAA